MTLHIRETFVNATENTRFGESEWQDTGLHSAGKLFRRLTREYGRCSGKMGTDRNGKSEYPIGWVFESRQYYEDDREYGQPRSTYMREVWVEVREVPEGLNLNRTVTIEELMQCASVLKSVDGENPEYDRALVELVADVSGLGETMDIAKPIIAAEIGVKLA